MSETQLTILLTNQPFCTCLYKSLKAGVSHEVLPAAQHMSLTREISSLILAKWNNFFHITVKSADCEHCIAFKVFSKQKMLHRKACLGIISEIIT